MAGGDKPNQNSKWTWKTWLATAFVAYVAFVMVWKAVSLVGLAPNPFQHEPRIADDRPRWDNEECLTRNQYRIRQMDPTITDGPLFSQVAAECVREKHEFQGY